MENIIEPTNLFDFTKIHLAHPIGIQGGAYFTKILSNDKPLYIQTTKSLTRQGFVKSGKKYYIDLMFDKNSEVLIHWFENLEERCHQLIYEKSDSWFQSSFDLNDIESAFNSIMRVYKSGKYYLVRTYVKNSINDEPSIKIYNENEIPLGIDYVTHETNIISILEIQGIKFTSRNFQVEIALKQMMVLNNEPIFENCLIKTKRYEKEKLLNQMQRNELLHDDKNLEKEKDGVDSSFQVIHDNNKDENFENKQHKEIFTTFHSNLEEMEEKEEKEDKKEKEDKEDKKEMKTNAMNETIDIDIEIEDLNNEPENQEEIKEIEVNMNSIHNLETLTLKKPNQVYFELYKEAKNKAKIAKKTAIQAYLEAKNIKKTYMLDDFIDDDSDFDEEIDEFSESELDGL